MSKRTIYARYPHKEALFRGAVAWRMQRWISENRLSIDSRCEDPIRAFVELSLNVLLTPDALAMSRILRGEDGRFPDLAGLARQRLDGAVAQLAGLLEAKGMTDHEEARETARCIIDMLVGRAVSVGPVPDKEERSRYLDDHLSRIFRSVECLGRVGDKD